MSFLRLLRVVLAVLSICLGSFVHNVDAEQRWQLTLSYSRQEVTLLDVKPFYERNTKKNSPGEHSASEVMLVKVKWYRKGHTLHVSTGEIPIGNRFEHSCSTYGDECVTRAEDITFFRVTGPIGTIDYDAVSVESATRSNGSRSVFATFQKSGTQPLIARSISKSGAVSITPLHISGKDTQRFVLVIMGDGFTQVDIDSGFLEAKARELSSYLSMQSPWDALWKLTNVYLVNVVSATSSVTDPNSGIIGDTFFETSFNRSGIDRILAPSITGKLRAVKVADEYVGTGVWDSVIILANSNKYGGSGGAIATVSLHPLSPEITVHELGHTVAGLADEYETSYPGYPAEVKEPNVDTNSLHPKWFSWLDADVPLPTPESVANTGRIGAYEGARYQTQGVYRPMERCKMRSLGVEFCSICKESMVKNVLSSMSQIEDVVPRRAIINMKKKGNRFSVRTLPFEQYDIQWSVCGKIIPSGTSSVLISKSMLQRKKFCSVHVAVTLHTPYIRQAGLIRSQQRWRVAQ